MSNENVISRQCGKDGEWNAITRVKEKPAEEGRPRGHRDLITSKEKKRRPIKSNTVICTGYQTLLIITKGRLQINVNVYETEVQI